MTQRATATLVLAALLASGCTDPGQTGPIVHSLEGDPGSVHMDPATGESLFLQPNWTIGRWWTVYLAVDFGGGFLQDIEGTLIVSGQDATGFRLGSDVEDVGIFDSYFDSFYHGRVGLDLNPIVQGEKVELFRWPLKHGDAWTAQWPSQGFEGFSGRREDVRLEVTAFEEDASPFAPRLRIQGNTSAGLAIDYDYSPRTGWMTYFRLVNTTTGQVVLKLDVRDRGLGYAGEVHHLAAEPVYQRFRMTPPFDPSFAPVPPLERATVAPTFAFVEEIHFLFTFPIGPAGGGEIATAVARPDGSTHRVLHTGAGDQFQMTFNRTQVRNGVSGEWSVSILPAGTGGAFVGLFGFHDEIVRL
jgi:hypothetical protein